MMFADTAACPTRSGRVPRSRASVGPLNVAVLLTANPIHGGDPALPGVIDTGIGHQQGLRLLDAHSIIIHQHVHGLSPASRIDGEHEVVEPNLSLLPPLADLLAEAEDPSEAERCDRTAPSIAQDDFRRQIIDPAVGIRAFVRPMAPKLVIVHEVGMLPVVPIHGRCTQRYRHPACDAGSRSPLRPGSARDVPAQSEPSECRVAADRGSGPQTPRHYHSRRRRVRPIGRLPGGRLAPPGRGFGDRSTRLPRGTDCRRRTGGC